MVESPLFVCGSGLVEGREYLGSKESVLKTLLVTIYILAEQRVYSTHCLVGL